MHELIRPPARVGTGERLRAALAFVGVGRLVAAAGSILLVAAGCWWLLHSPPPPVERTLPYAASSGSGTTSGASTKAGAGPGAGASSSAATAPDPSVPAGLVVVQAAGAVVHPGVYSLPTGARVHELIVAAGGALPGADPDALALAALLADGQRVYVPMPGEVVPGPVGGAGGGGSSAAAPAGPVDLNRATADELDGLPGVGPATAAAIVAHREQHGPFSSVDGLLDVRGIGPAKLDAIRALVTV